MNYTKKHLAPVLFFLVSFFYVKGQQTPPFETVTSFFEAFHKKDSLALYDFFDDEAKINFTSNTKEGTPVVKRLSIPDFVRRNLFFYRKNVQKKKSEMFVHVAPEKTK